MSKPIEGQEKYIDIITQIDENYKVMKNMRPLNPDAVGRYLEEFSISTSHSSNAIEGNSFTYDETRLLLKEGVASSARSFAEHQEIVGYKEGFDFLYDALKQNLPLGEELIKQIHSKVLLGKQSLAGKYRETQIYIGDMFNVTFTPCEPRFVPEKMREYVVGLQKDMAENIKIKDRNETPAWVSLFHNLAKHHIEFERIHPFTDGNGRTGRLMLIYEMISTGLLPVDIRYSERSRYYAALKEYEVKAKYSIRPESKTESMAKLLAESELRSMLAWTKMFADFIVDDSAKKKEKIEINPLRVYKEDEKSVFIKRRADDGESKILETLPKNQIQIKNNYVVAAEIGLITEKSLQRPNQTNRKIKL
jgi:Fic family protein